MPSFLVVDDSPTIRLAIAAALRALHPSAPCAIVEAASEREALERFSQARFDAVFLDMMLGGDRSAVDALRGMLAFQPEARIVLMTGLAREHPEVVEAVSLGAFSYLRKPVRASDIEAVLQEMEQESGRMRRIR